MGVGGGWWVGEGLGGGKQDHLETFINMPVFPRSPKDSRKIVKMKREVPVAQLFSREAPRVFAAKKKEEKELEPNLCPDQESCAAL